MLSTGDYDAPNNLVKDYVSIKIVSPGSIANIGPGFDILGLSINNFKDTIIVEAWPGNGEVIVESYGYNVPSGKNNLAYQIVKAFLKKYDVIGVDIRIRIHKGVPPNSGLGSSGASGAGVAYGLFTIFRPSFSEKELLYIAGKGEEYVAGTPHYDNVAASLFGGIILIDPLDMSVYKFKLSNPPRIVIVKPHINGLDKKTKYARQILPKQIDLKTHVVQTSLLSKLLLGMITNDLELLGKAINQDYIAEPYRSKLIPYYWEVKAIALRHGALEVNIAGAGPSIFMLVRDQEDAEYLAGIVRDYYYSKNIPVEVFITTPNPGGTRIVERCC